MKKKTIIRILTISLFIIFLALSIFYIIYNRRHLKGRLNISIKNQYENVGITKDYLYTFENGILKCEDKDLKLVWERDTGLKNGKVYYGNHNIYITEAEQFKILNTRGEVIKEEKFEKSLIDFDLYGDFFVLSFSDKIKIYERFDSMSGEIDFEEDVIFTDISPKGKYIFVSSVKPEEASLKGVLNMFDVKGKLLYRYGIRNDIIQKSLFVNDDKFSIFTTSKVILFENNTSVASKNFTSFRDVGMLKDNMYFLIKDGIVALDSNLEKIEHRAITPNPYNKVYQDKNKLIFYGGKNYMILKYPFEIEEKTASNEIKSIKSIDGHIYFVYEDYVENIN